MLHAVVLLDLPAKNTGLEHLQAFPILKCFALGIIFSKGLSLRLAHVAKATEPQHDRVRKELLRRRSLGTKHCDPTGSAEAMFL